MDLNLLSSLLTGKYIILKTTTSLVLFSVVYFFTQPSLHIFMRKKSSSFLYYRGIACGAGNFYAINFPAQARLQEGVFVRFNIPVTFIFFLPISCFYLFSCQAQFLPLSYYGGSVHCAKSASGFLPGPFSHFESSSEITKFSVDLSRSVSEK